MSPHRTALSVLLLTLWVSAPVVARDTARLSDHAHSPAPYVSDLDEERRRRVHAEWAGDARLARDSARQGQTLWECPMCPQMVVLPLGTYTIGSADYELGRAPDEGPQRQVKISRPFAVSRFEVTRAEYEAFLEATGHPVSGNCITDRVERGNWQPNPETHLRDPGYPQLDSHPVVCVSWNDAQAYIAWLNSVTRGGYRLLTESEWEYAARAGGSSAYIWGTRAEDACEHMNGSDERLRGKYPETRILPAGENAPCDDGAINTNLVGSYHPNAFGLYDMSGNVAEWVQDCQSANYVGLPNDGTPLESDCLRRMVRGGSWGTYMRQLRVAERFRYEADARDDSLGIRVALSLR